MDCENDRPEVFRYTWRQIMTARGFLGLSGNAPRTLTYGYGKDAFLVGQGVPSVWDSLTRMS